MQIINLIDNLERVNFGIWNAAIATAPILKNQFGAESHLWYPAIADAPNIEHVQMRAFEQLNGEAFQKAIQEGNFSPTNTVIVSHGCWQFPTRIGAKLHQMGFPWVMVPHGMLEPWSMQQKRLKKLIYFHLMEKRLINQADAIRAVGTPEYKNLGRMLVRQPVLMPNGIPKQTEELPEKAEQPKHFLFMARLHHKKGVLPMVEAWAQSQLANKEAYQLTIAGPDDGELDALKAFIQRSKANNIKYVGAVYGAEKEALLRRSHFFLLPSFSEGFPTSLLEAMQYGMIPLMTDGCNFPEAFEAKMAIKVSPLASDILAGLQQATALNNSEIQAWGIKAAAFVNQNYNLETIAKQQFAVYQKLIAANT